MMHKSCVFVHSDVCPVSEVPCGSFLNGVCVRVTLLLLVFGGSRGRNDGGIDDSAFLQNQTAIGQIPDYHGEELFMDAVLNQQIPELTDCVSVRNLIA